MTYSDSVKHILKFFGYDEGMLFAFSYEEYGIEEVRFAFHNWSYEECRSKSSLLGLGFRGRKACVEVRAYNINGKNTFSNLRSPHYDIIYGGSRVFSNLNLPELLSKVKEIIS